MVFLKRQTLINTLIVNRTRLRCRLCLRRDASAGLKPASEVIMKELGLFWKFTSPVKTISLGCKESAVKRILSFHKQFFTFLNNEDETLNGNFKCKDGDSSYTVYATHQCFPAHTEVCSWGQLLQQQQQQRGDSQRENSGEPEPGVNDSRSSDTPEPEVEGEPFSQEEMDEMLSAALDPDKQLVFYREFVGTMTLDDPR
ncbi:hypothetical protein PHYPO_G00020610 [Pangasianodon hypophthalmus]|uniref:Uncharacterized protein n=1 Tax=Pangasianodon hypophthalmus TaxID=310915 RepID=A0A5N5N563_PANHP|nr:hypothetical protein PHYPO_G00020610 [Pangasianodon hypophthalmus]